MAESSGSRGLMLGLAAQRGIDAVCLMGETSGYIVDPMRRQMVLTILSKLIDVPVDLTKLNDQASENGKVHRKVCRRQPVAER